MSATARVRALTRSGVRRRRTWSDRYITLFGLVLLAVLASPLLGRALEAVPADTDPARAGAGLALTALLAAGALALARAAGPLGVSPADAAWLLLTPLPRRAVLTPALLVLAAVCAVLGAAAGLALTSALGAPGALLPRLSGLVLLGLAWAVAAASATVLGQASQAWDTAVVAMIAVLVAAAAAAAVLGAGPGQRALTALATAPGQAWAAVAAVSVAGAAALAVRAWAAAGRIPARAVLEASRRTGLAAGAVTGLDPGPLAWIAEDAHWRGRTLRSRPWPARLRGAAAVAWPDWKRLGRRPALLALAAATAVLPALAALAGLGGAGVPLVLAAGAAAVASAGTAGARRDAGDAALARLLGAAPRALLAARAVLPAVLGGAWLTLALTALEAVGATGALWPLGPLCAPALAAGALRMARRRPVEHTAPVMDTPLGPVPLGPLRWALTGADLALLGCLPALAAFAAGPGAALYAAQALCGAAVLAAYCAAPRRG
ncbi:DUF6297 family protein [Nocardiopsis flavescens]